MRIWVILAAVVPCAMLLVSCKCSDARRSEAAPTGSSSPDETSSAAFLDGDLIFQESTSSQSEMVRALTNSHWTHMGVVFHNSSGIQVFEAVSPVRWTELRKWIARGRDGHYVVKRLRDSDKVLTPAVLAKMRDVGSNWLGRAYDVKFQWDDGSLYCSELVHKLYDQGAGVQLGKLQHASDMNLDDERVQQAIRRRFGNTKFDPGETVVTPDSIFSDPRLATISP